MFMFMMKFQQNTLQFYGTVITEADTLHIEPLVQLGPVKTTNKVAVSSQCWDRLYLCPI